MGLFSWLFESDTDSFTSDDSSPSVNCDGTPMIPDSGIDVEGKSYGDMGDSMSSSSFDSSSDSFGSSMDSGIDDSCSSISDDW